MIVFAVGPSGCSPTLRAHNTTDPGGCLNLANSFVLAYNSALKELLIGLHEAIPDFNIVLADRYDTTIEIITEGKHFGNTHTLVSRLLRILMMELLQSVW